MIIAVWYNWTHNDSGRWQWWREWREVAVKVKVAGPGYLPISNDLHRALFGKSESVNGETIRPVRVLKYFIFAEMLLFLSNCQLHKQYNIPNITLASRNKQKWGYSGGQEGEWSDLHQFLDERSTKARSERVCLCALSPVSNFIFIFAWLNFTPPTQLPMLASLLLYPFSFLARTGSVWN